MLTCEICGEELLLEEDMRTHLVVIHLEQELRCPLCSLSGVSYDELCLHISCAHPEERPGAQGPPRFMPPSGCPAGTEAPQSRSAEGSWVTPPAASSVPTDSVLAHHNKALDAGGSPPGESATARSTKTSPECVALCNEDDDGVKSEHSEAKQRRLSVPRKEKLFSCPMCALACSSCFLLQEHVELHLQEQRSHEVSAPEACSPARTSAPGSTLYGGSPLKEHGTVSLFWPLA
ncbi:hypothetical protein FQN60_017369, partial [Etheostoma spectabile]